MDPLLEFGLNATRWLQTNYPQWEGFFQFITALGREEFYLALFPLVYWCIHKKMGKHFAYLFLLSVALNTMMKHALRGPRPFWLDPVLERATEVSYGIPSGHVQYATLIYPFLALWIRRRWAWLAAIMMIILMGLSRIYLGVHFVHDVIAGFLISVLLLVSYVIWRRRWEETFARRILGQRLLVMMLIPLGLTAVYLLIRFLIGLPDENVSWAVFAAEAELSGPRDMTTAVAALLGTGIGIVLESSRVRFLMAGPIWQRALRYLLGMIVAVAIWLGLGQIFPDDPLWLGLPLRFIRYGLLTLWVTFYAPMTFVRLHLADAEPEPEINLSLRS